MQATCSTLPDISEHQDEKNNSHGLTITKPLPPEFMNLFSHYELSTLRKILEKWTGEASSKGSLSFGLTKKVEKCSASDPSRSIFSSLFKQPEKNSVDILYEHPDLAEPFKTSIVFGYDKNNKPVVSRIIQYLYDKGSNVFPNSLPSTECSLAQAINIEVMDILRQANSKCKNIKY